MSDDWAGPRSWPASALLRDDADLRPLALEAMAALEESTIFADAWGVRFARRSPYLPKWRRERQCETEGFTLAPPHTTPA